MPINDSTIIVERKFSTRNPIFSFNNCRGVNRHKIAIFFPLNKLPLYNTCLLCVDDDDAQYSKFNVKSCLFVVSLVGPGQLHPHESSSHLPTRTEGTLDRELATSTVFSLIERTRKK